MDRNPTGSCNLGVILTNLQGFLGGASGKKKKKKQTKKQKTCLPMQETQEMWVRSLGGEDSLEKDMATHSSVLA